MSRVKVIYSEGDGEEMWKDFFFKVHNLVLTTSDIFSHKIHHVLCHSIYLYI